MGKKTPQETNSGFEHGVRRRRLFVGIVQLLFGWMGALFFGIAIIGFVAGPDRSFDHIPPLLVTVLLFFLCIQLIRLGSKNMRYYRASKGWVGESSHTATPPSAVTTSQTTVTVGATQAQAAGMDGHTAPVKMECTSCGAVVTPDADGRCEYCGTRLTL